ncbi:MAG: hypothetical protein F4Z87_02150, partial [Gammaproteobacteria bacterium]|nr:hypothetical protein [Gammaproteobacteria bacterium]
YNLVYIGGGDTGRLMDQIEKSGFKSLIPEFIDAGGYVFGGSAGAIAMGKSVLTAPEDEETATLTTGINCIGDWSAYPHYDNNSAEEVRELARRLNSNIVAIPEESGVIYDGELIAVGAGVEFFYARR